MPNNNPHKARKLYAVIETTSDTDFDSNRHRKKINVSSFFIKLKTHLHFIYIFYVSWLLNRKKNINYYNTL